MKTSTIETRDRENKDFLPLNGTDHIELYVGNAKQAAYYYKSAFGFQSMAYAGPETGVKAGPPMYLFKIRSGLCLLRL